MSWTQLVEWSTLDETHIHRIGERVPARATAVATPPLTPVRIRSCNWIRSRERFLVDAVVCDGDPKTASHEHLGAGLIAERGIEDLNASPLPSRLDTNPKRCNRDGAEQLDTEPSQPPRTIVVVPFVKHPAHQSRRRAAVHRARTPRSCADRSRHERLAVHVEHAITHPAMVAHPTQTDGRMDARADRGHAYRSRFPAGNPSDYGCERYRVWGGSISRARAVAGASTSVSLALSVHGRLNAWSAAPP